MKFDKLLTEAFDDSIREKAEEMEMLKQEAKYYKILEQHTICKFGGRDKIYGIFYWPESDFKEIRKLYWQKSGGAVSYTKPEYPLWDGSGPWIFFSYPFSPYIHFHKSLKDLVKSIEKTNFNITWLSDKEKKIYNKIKELDIDPNIDHNDFIKKFGMKKRNLETFYDILNNY